jgi:hypothetical protein
MSQCGAITLKGSRCKNKPVEDKLCRIHLKEVKPLASKPLAARKPSAKKESRGGCVEQFVGHYVTASRKSPAFPANECHGRVMEGRDGAMWVSKPASNGVYRWFKY